MSTTHHTIYYVQFAVYLSGIIISLFYKEMVFFCFVLAIIAEIFLLEVQRKIPSEKIYYKKSCFFALLDLWSVGCFISCLGGHIGKYYHFGECNYLNTAGLIVFSYTLLRKIYIYKNYTYEK